MVFDDNDLIQANATIISGVLILLSLASLSRTSSLPLLDRTMIASAIIPFIASTILLLNLRLNEAKRTDYARKLAIGGLSAMFTAPSLASRELFKSDGFTNCRP
jgi:hypothetical protein